MRTAIGQSVGMNVIAFLFDGRRLQAQQTPDELEMEEGDEIDAMLHQTGGGCHGPSPGFTRLEDAGQEPVVLISVTAEDF
ncbi:putative Ubiquitin-like domain-containing protein [Helianthus annuus]|nr:putative Ubiquitin-like domain-containing protein [Helianthus annuus]